MSCPNIDGFLVGGASLLPEFADIMKVWLAVTCDQIYQIVFHIFSCKITKYCFYSSYDIAFTPVLSISLLVAIPYSIIYIICSAPFKLIWEKLLRDRREIWDNSANPWLGAQNLKKNKKNNASYQWNASSVTSNLF